MARLRIRLDPEGRPAAAEVVLSRRNLLALLHKLDMPGSARMIVNTDVEVDGVFAPGFDFMLRCEDDLEHYAHRVEAPGEMHPQTEAFVRHFGGWSRVEG